MVKFIKSSKVWDVMSEALVTTKDPMILFVLTSADDYECTELVKNMRIKYETKNINICYTYLSTIPSNVFYKYLMGPNYPATFLINFKDSDNCSEDNLKSGYLNSEYIHTYLYYAIDQMVSNKSLGSIYKTNHKSFFRKETISKIKFLDHVDLYNMWAFAKINIGRKKENGNRE
jgi:hypothetical protein